MIKRIFSKKICLSILADPYTPNRRDVQVILIKLLNEHELLNQCTKMIADFIKA